MKQDPLLERNNPVYEFENFQAESSSSNNNSRGLGGEICARSPEPLVIKLARFVTSHARANVLL